MGLFVILALVLGSFHFGALEPLKTSLYELRFKLTPRPPTGELALVDIDAKSIAAIGTWPWPRRIHAALVDALSDYGVSQIGFDVDFSSPSVSEEDQVFEDALRRAGGGVVLAAFNQKLSHESGERRVASNRPIPRFAEHSWAGSVNVFADRDGLVRRFPSGDFVGGEPTPSMPVMFANTEQELGREFVIDFGIQAPKIDRMSLIDVLAKGVEERRLAGKKVIIGASAVELRDFFQVPVFGHIPGPLLQILAAETLIQGRALQETGVVVSLVGVLLIVALGSFCFPRVRWATGLALVATLALLVEGSGAVIQQLYPLLLDTSAWQATFVGLALLGTAREIDFRRVLLALSRREAQDTRTVLDQVVADNFAGVIVATDDGLIQAGSRTAGELLGCGDPRELVGRSIDEALPPALTEVIRQAINQYRAGDWRPREPGDLDYTRGDDTGILEYVVTPSHLSSDDGTSRKAGAARIAACLTFVDITERRHAESRIAYMARFDVLTGLPNQNQFQEKLAQAIEGGRAKGEGCTILYFDLDRFKTVNDTLGRDYGDLLLREAAARARKVAGPADVVARLDGDQFAVLRPGGVSEEDARALGAELIASLNETYVLNGHRAIVGISVGIAQCTAEEDSASLIKNAETAHRRAKTAGGNVSMFFDPKLDLGLRARQSLEMDMRDALDRDEFSVVYQPQVDLASREIIGVEALVRWQHPERGPISPVEFIPLAEDTGLVEPLGAFVLRRACEDAAAWAQPIKVAVNVSPIQFTRGDLVARVNAALQSSGLPPSRLDLEITESLFINESSQIATVTDALRGMGISFSLDDFGTGYSSLNYLLKFRVQKIKLDKSFITGLPHDHESVAIVRAVCALAGDLGIRINAEGVETAEQMNSLRLLGCKEAQGYLFSKPIAAVEIARILETHVQAPHQAA
jgi:diguanylate cyclase (GGDEF)-like protein